MMTNWQTLPLGAALTFQRGFDITKDEQCDGAYPVISSSGPKTTHSVFKVRGPGVVIGRKGSLGTVFYADGDYWPHDTTLWVKNFHGNYPRFAYYFLQTMGFQRLDAGASNPSLNRNHIHTIPVYWPPLPVQKKIAAVLSAYDDLIENNERRIRILEEMAQNLYREWFVKFRFPGHEKVKMVDSPLGKIPQGWEVKCLGEVSDNWDSKRKPLSSMERTEMQGVYPYYGAAKVLDHVNDYLFEGRYLLLAEDGSVITTEGHPVLQIARHRFWVNNHTHILTGKPGVSLNFLYLLLSDVAIAGHITGAAQPKITQANLNRIPVLLPTLDIRRTFDAYVEGWLELAESLADRNTNLRQTRDLLLPKLISGEVDVSDLDIKVPEKAA